MKHSTNQRNLHDLIKNIPAKVLETLRKFFANRLAENLSQTNGDENRIQIRDDATRFEKITYLNQVAANIKADLLALNNSTNMSAADIILKYINLYSRFEALQVTYGSELSTLEPEETVSFPKNFVELGNLFVNCFVYEKYISVLDEEILSAANVKKMIAANNPSLKNDATQGQPMFSLMSEHMKSLLSSDISASIQSQAKTISEKIDSILTIIKDDPAQITGQRVFKIVHYLNLLSVRYSGYRDLFLSILYGPEVGNQFAMLTNINSQFDSSAYSKTVDIGAYLAGNEKQADLLIKSLPADLKGIFDNISLFLELNHKLQEVLNDMLNGGTPPTQESLDSLRSLVPSGASACGLLFVAISTLLGGVLVAEPLSAAGFDSPDGQISPDSTIDFNGYGGVEAYMRYMMTDPSQFSSLSTDLQQSHLESISLEVGGYLLKNSSNDAAVTNMISVYSLMISSVGVEKDSPYYLPTKRDEFKAKKGEIIEGLKNKYLAYMSKQTGKSASEITQLLISTNLDSNSSAKVVEIPSSKSVPELVVPVQSKDDSSSSTVKKTSSTYSSARLGGSKKSDSLDKYAGLSPEQIKRLNEINNIYGKAGSEETKGKNLQFGSGVTVSPSSIEMKGENLEFKGGTSLPSMQSGKTGLYEDPQTGMKSLNAPEVNKKSGKEGDNKFDMLQNMNYSLEAKTDNEKLIAGVGAEGRVLNEHSFVVLKGYLMWFYDLMSENDGLIHVKIDKSLGDYMQSIEIGTVNVFEGNWVLTLGAKDYKQIKTLVAEGNEKEIMAHARGLGIDLEKRLGHDWVKALGVSYAYTKTDTEFLGMLGYETRNVGGSTELWKKWWFAVGYEEHKAGLTAKIKPWEGARLELEAGGKASLPVRDLGKKGSFGQKLKVEESELPDEFTSYGRATLTQQFDNRRGEAKLSISAPDGITNITKSYGLSTGVSYYVAPGFKVGPEIYVNKFGNSGVKTEVGGIFNFSFEFSVDDYGSDLDALKKMQHPELFAELKDGQKVKLTRADAQMPKGLRGDIIKIKSHIEKERMTKVDNVTTFLDEIGGVKYVRLATGVNLAAGAALLTNPAGVESYFNVLTNNTPNIHVKVEDLPTIQSKTNSAASITMSFTQSGGGVFVGQYNAVYGSMTVSFRRSISGLSADFATQFVPLVNNSGYTIFIDDVFSGELDKAVAREMLLSLGNFAGTQGSNIFQQYLNGRYSATVMEKVSAGIYTAGELAQLENGTMDPTVAENKTGTDTTPPSTPVFTINGGDTYAPSQTVTLNVTDNADIAAWFVTETNSAPAAGDGGWTTTKPTSYTFSATQGTRTLYIFSKDAAGNVQSVGGTDSIILDSVPLSSLSFPGTVPDTKSTVYNNLKIRGNKSLVGATNISLTATNGGVITFNSIDGNGDIDCNLTTPNAAGFQIRVSGTDRAGTAFSNITLTVSGLNDPANQPPTFNGQNFDDTLVQYSTFGSYTLGVATDPENAGPLTYGLTGIAQLGAGVTFDPSTRTLSGLITASPGTYVLVYTATDADNISTSMNINYTVTGTAPTSAPSNFALSAASDTGISSTDMITSDDTATFTWSAYAGATSYEFQIDSGSWTDVGNVLTYTTPVLSEGTHSVKVRAKNASGVGPASTLGGIEIDKTNNITTVGWSSATPSIQGTQYNNLTYDFAGESVAEIVSINSSAGGTINGISLVSGTRVKFNWLTPTAVGSTLTFTVKDAAGVQKTLNQGVTLPTEGVVPVLSTIPDQTLTAGTAATALNLFTYRDTSYGDVDATTGASITAGSLPPGMSLNTSTGAITGTPTDVGTYSVTVNISDKDGDSLTKTFNYTVNFPAAVEAVGGVVPDTKNTATAVEYSLGVSLTGGTLLGAIVEYWDGSGWQNAGAGGWTVLPSINGSGNIAGTVAGFSADSIRIHISASKNGINLGGRTVGPYTLN